MVERRFVIENGDAGIYTEVGGWCVPLSMSESDARRRCRKLNAVGYHAARVVMLETVDYTPAPADGADNMCSTDGEKR